MVHIEIQGETLLALRAWMSDIARQTHQTVSYDEAMMLLVPEKYWPLKTPKTFAEMMK